MRTILLLALLATSTACAARDYMPLTVDGSRYSVPANPTVIGASLSDDAILILRYGEQPGRNYLSFEDVTELTDGSYGCPAAEFYRRMFTKEPAGACDAELLAAFRQQFLSNGTSEIWPAAGGNVYWTSLGGQAFAFQVNDAGNVIKIESDFLTLKDFERLLPQADGATR